MKMVKYVFYTLLSNAIIFRVLSDVSSRIKFPRNAQSIIPEVAAE